MRLVRGDLLPDIDPTINVARAKQWDEASQMAARQLFLGRSASEAIVTAHAERITLITGATIMRKIAGASIAIVVLASRDCPTGIADASCQRLAAVREC